jgi:hypothetical protein
MSNTNWWEIVSFFGLNQDFLLTYEGNPGVRQRAGIISVGVYLIYC